MDYNFYQSQLRQHINRDIYRKPVGMITIAGQQCQYVIKRKSVVGVTLNRYQILWLELPVAYLTDPILFHQKVMSVCHQQFAGQGDCFVQLWLSNQLWITDTRKTKLDWYHDQRDARRRQQGSGIMRLGGYEWVVENMPAATIMLDLSISGDELFAQFGRSTRTHIRKAQKHWLTVETATRADWDSYYEIRSSTGDSKWFAVQSRVCYDALRNYLLTTNQWQLYVVRDGDTIIAGAICVQVDDVYVYLYGGTRRGIGNLGHAQLLHWEIIQSAQTQWFAYYDLLGCAPWSLQPHHLDGVTQFKAWFGWVKIEYLGSYDFPLSQWKYNMFRRYRKTKW
jgi:hypothetical protein